MKALRAQVVTGLVLALVAMANVGMAQRGSGSRVVPHCAKMRKNSVAWSADFVFPRHAKYKKVKDVDYVVYYVWADESKSERMEIWSQVNNSALNVTCGEGASPNDRIESLKNVDGQIKGNDVRCSGKGKLSRKLGWNSTLVQYSNVGESAAKYFDSIIATMCSTET